MLYKKFKKDIIEGIVSQLEEKAYTVEMKETIGHCNNYEGVCIQLFLNGSNVASTLFPECLYESYKDSDMTVKEMASRLAEDIVSFFNENHFAVEEKLLSYLQPDFVRKNALIKVINKDMNLELLKSSVHWEIPGTDLAVVSRISIEGIGSIRITDSILRYLGMTEEEVIKCATENSLSQDFVIVNVLSIVQEAFSNFQSVLDEKEQLYLLTNRDNLFGASVLLSFETLDQACSVLDCEELFILPLSIHKVLAVNASLAESAEMKATVESINKCLPDEEVLSDNIYLYRKGSRCYEMCDSDGNFPSKLQNLTEQLS